ncbi:alpha-1-acid glycoprotein 2-like [Equus asinus]|uniref:Lipocalin/cytosolic fatty-acid binding domain-containing protein n=1 Tax=Equus asinus TaxID=9793 RepID=A0A8C4MZA8_EQUAS|nr:alpha-1-acid glycoprotein 2-like [Equus asinus]XP_046537771.1 alpha-1-acid glycoprotein 2-like [Equus quagga]
MALPWALAVLSLLPLLEARSLGCANFTAAPMTNATLDRISGKWFYIAGASHNPEYLEFMKTYQASYFYCDANHTEDTIQLREYSTIGNKCVYNFSILTVQRENGTITTNEMGREHIGHVWFTKDPSIILFVYFPDDKQKIALFFCADKANVTEEQMSEFHEAIVCVGMDKSEIMYTDEKQDQCGPLEKQHEEERKKKQEEA